MCDQGNVLEHQILNCTHESLVIGHEFGPSESNDLSVNEFGGNQSDVSYSNEDAIFFHNPSEMLIPWIMNLYFFPVVMTYVVTFIIGVTGNVIVIWVMAGENNWSVM
jgi:hypothetical protein